MSDPTEVQIRFKSCVEVRAYVYAVMASMLEQDASDESCGWMFGGIDSEFDRRRLRKEIAKAKAFCLKRAQKLVPRG